MDFVSFKDSKYPLFQSFGNASQFSIPFAKYYCKGLGYDIGFCKEEWKFPGAIGIDLLFFFIYFLLYFTNYKK